MGNSSANEPPRALALAALNRLLAASLCSRTASGPQARNEGIDEASIMPTATFKAGDQPSGGPSGELSQSRAAIAAPVSPPLVRKADDGEGVRGESTDSSETAMIPN